MDNREIITSSSIQQTTNDRIFSRNIPSQFLQPYLNVRPVNTKYSRMPIVDPRAIIETKLVNAPIYNTHTVFNPGNTKSPWSGYASNVNKESELRNQIYALQKCSQSVYVPSHKSDLYNPTINHITSGYVEQPFNRLFINESFDSFNPNPQDIGYGLFNNCTRQQLKDFSDKSNNTTKNNTNNNDIIKHMNNEHKK